MLWLGVWAYRLLLDGILDGNQHLSQIKRSGCCFFFAKLVSTKTPFSGCSKWPSISCRPKKQKKKRFTVRCFHFKKISFFFSFLFTVFLPHSKQDVVVFPKNIFFLFLCICCTTSVALLQSKEAFFSQIFSLLRTDERKEKWWKKWQEC